MGKWAQLASAIAMIATIISVAPSARAETPTTTPSTSNPPSSSNRLGAKWVVEVDGAACVKHRSLFEREISLACEAMGTCRISSRRDAELEATLQCDAGADGAWRLRTRTVEGTDLGSVELTGSTPDDRMREAAMEIARDAAPERTLATESLRHTLTPDTGDKVKLLPAQAPPVFTLTAAAFTTTRADEAAGYGGRINGGYRIGSVSHAVVGIGASGGGAEATAFRRVRGGAGVGFGAPFDAKVIGVIFEAGVDGTQSYPGNQAYALSNTRNLTAQTTFAAYFQQSVVLQVPLKTIRPYAAFSIALLTAGPHISGGLDVGMALPIF